jgi:DNA polymerase III epsilon subunit-like protein
MRKLYPGGDSYSLAALCQRFDIPLKTHHRAMCDAEAAAQLLLIVNEKRAEALRAACASPGRRRLRRRVRCRYLGRRPGEEKRHR